MREILFKAKRIDNEEWVEGNYLCCEGSTTVSFQNEHYILVFDGYGVVYHAIDKDTICQYTGLTDKNGCKIWENDIVEDNVVFGQVVWDEKYVQFMIDDEWDGHQDYSDWWQDVEVIGNIFDNAELAEGK